MSSPLNAQRTAITKASTANEQIVAAVAGEKQRMLGLQLVAAGDCTVTVASSTGLALWGPAALGAKGGFVLQPNAIGYAESSVGKGLFLECSTTQQVGGGVQHQAVGSTS